MAPEMTGGRDIFAEEWEAYSCCKIIPQGAIYVRGYDDFVPMGGQVHPVRDTGTTTWTVKFRNGTSKRFAINGKEGGRWPYTITVRYSANKM